MATYVLDTNTLTLLGQSHPRVMANLASHTRDTVVITTVNVEEALGGWYTRARNAKTKADLATASQRLAEAAMLIGRFPVYPLTEPAIDQYAQLVRLKLNIGKNDLRIAAIAMELGAVVVTNNVRDFGRVPGLVTEDWSV
jgi:tRNA(fMet)-specific endonuclease VapC